MPLDTHIGLRAFADELARCGLRHACTSPGSRSTPLVLALVREPRIETTSHLDERCGGFFALGQAKATHRPVALACTSGTATANYLPAVVEAYEARVPLLVLTADRPPELRDVGAGQTIDQVKLYGRNAKWYLEVDEAPATPERLRWLRELAARAWATAQEGRPGPVHLNFVLREPLAPGEELPPAEEAPPATYRRPAPPRAPGALVEELKARPRAVIVAGGGADGPQVAEFARRCRVPVLADPLSGARRGEAIAHYDALLRNEEWAVAHRPDLVIRIGDLPTSKPLRQWLSDLPGARQVALDEHFALHDPAGVVDETLPGESAALEEVPTVWGGDEWVDGWAAADQAAGRAIGEALGDGVSEPLAVARLWGRLPHDATLVVASSMPVRDLETFAPTVARPPRVLANRGANGIDGTVSTAFGAASVCNGPTVLLIGDVALLHDVGGLIAARRLGLDLKIVLLNNDGGGIFHFLPVAGERDAFEEHVATPHGVDFAHAAALYGLEHDRPADMAQFAAALDRALETPGPRLVELRTDRVANVDHHRRVWESVRLAS
jgi:2-succinyl-5-enolpyruvyl-6-hydroxy-3-cyclohexene-1-carboxylate synthase